MHFEFELALAYNIGRGKSGVADGFCEARRGGASTLVQRLNAFDYKGACDAILDWRFVGDVDCAAPGNRQCGGLWARRLKTHRQCLGLPVIAGPASVIAGTARPPMGAKP